MTQEERTALIKEIKELLLFDYDSRISSYGKIFEDDNIKLMKRTLIGLITMSAL